MGKKKNRGNRKTSTSSSESSKAESPVVQDNTIDEQSVVQTSLYATEQVDSQSVNEEFYDAGDATESRVEDVIAAEQQDIKDVEENINGPNEQIMEPVVAEETSEHVEQVKVAEGVGEKTNTNDEDIAEQTVQVQETPVLIDNESVTKVQVAADTLEDDPVPKVVEEDDEFDDFVEASPSKTSPPAQVSEQVSFEDLLQMITDRHGAEIEATVMAKEVPPLPSANLDEIRFRAMEMFEECRAKSRPQVRFSFAQSEFYQRLLSHQSSV